MNHFPDQRRRSCSIFKSLYVIIMPSIRRDFQTSPSQVSVFLWLPWHVIVNTAANLVLLHAAVAAPWWEMSFGFLCEMLEFKPFVMQCVKKLYCVLLIPRTVLHTPYSVQALYKRKWVTGFMWKCMDSVMAQRHSTAKYAKITKWHTL